VLAHGRVLMEGGRVTVVDEDLVRERFAAAVRERVYQPPAEVRRWAELGTLVEPYLAPLYQPWYDAPVEPAHVYNARRAGGDAGGGDAGGGDAGGGDAGGGDAMAGGGDGGAAGAAGVGGHSAD
jgi:hypothetical protein